ncbi:MAG TPA: Hsp20/alpha crystallin family protein [Vicinamibacterales bacterium]|jgi:HSP20 family protein|nr:Hsp20/alpha crystallin family protein [Vicinamibacterales bacterium]
MFKTTETLPTLLGSAPIMRTFAKEFDRLFEDRAWPFFFTPQVEVQEIAWRPEVEIFELENLLKIRVDLPGLKKEEVNVELTDVGLTIAGERKREIKEEKKGEFYRSERVYGAFRRIIPLPETAKLEEVKAEFINGVLEVTVPLKARIETKKRLVPIAEVPVEATKTAA